MLELSRKESRMDKLELIQDFLNSIINDKSDKKIVDLLLDDTISDDKKIKMILNDKL